MNTQYILKEIDYTKTLGSGSYAKVYRGVLADPITQTNQLVAVKHIREDKNLFVTNEDCIKEINIMEVLTASNTPNIVKLLGYFVDNEIYTIVMGYAHQGSLQDWLTGQQHPYFNDSQQLHIMRGIANGLYHLHDMKIIHCDIKPANILIDHFEPMLCDFGLSIRKGIDYPDIAGSFIYFAPEILAEYDSAVNSKETDIYSFGLVCWQIVAQSTRFSSFNCRSWIDMVDWVVKQEQREVIPGHCPKSIASFITWGWAAKPSDRPTAKQAYEMLSDIEEAQTGLQKRCIV